MSAGTRQTPPGHKSPKKRARSKSASPAPSRASTQQLTTAIPRSAMGKWTQTTVQQSKTTTKARLGRKTTAAQTAMKLTRSQLETVLLRWNGIKSFDTNGFYWMYNRTQPSGYRALPCYLFDLTSLQQNPSGTYCEYPFVNLQQTGTNMLFTPFPHKKADGVTDTTRWELEKSPTTTPVMSSKSMLKSLSIKLNCWGAKTKAAAYTIQLVKFLDDEICPDHTGGAASSIALATPKRNDFWQNLMKPLVFSPIAQTGGAYKGRMKVLKSETFTLQPNSADDGDTDPNVRTVSMYVAMNRILSYQESATVLTTEADTEDQADFAVNTTAQFKPQTRPKSRVYLMIRCSNYKQDAAESNVDTPSFDLMVRANHQVTV